MANAEAAHGRIKRRGCVASAVHAVPGHCSSQGPKAHHAGQCRATAVGALPGGCVLLGHRRRAASLGLWEAAQPPACAILLRRGLTFPKTRPFPDLFLPHDSHSGPFLRT